MRLGRVDAERFVAGAGNREVARCDGGDISWQAQYFVTLCTLDLWTWTCEFWSKSLSHT